jgi:CRP/FNR family cyclic AMP-dependent transcriptional regulator
MPNTEERPVDFRMFKDINLLETHYAPGSEIIGPGKAVGLMYVIKSGLASVQVQGVTVEEVREGGIFGEMSIVDPRPASASVFAVTDVSVFVVNQTQFLQLVANAPSFALRVMKVLVRRVRAMNSRLQELQGTAEFLTNGQGAL